MPTSKKSRKPRMPEGFNEDDFSFSKLYKVVNKIGQNVICDVARAMYSHESMETNDGTMLLGVYLKDVRNWSNSKIKDKITKLHKSFLEENLLEVDIDISLGHVVMSEVCDDLYNSLDDNCKDAIIKLKVMRNKICHKYGIKSSELNSWIEPLKDIYISIYEGVGKVLTVDFTSKIRDTNTAIDHILSARVAQIDIQSYEEEVKAFRTNLKFILINDGKNELKEHYSKLQILNPCIWMSEQEVNATATLREFRTDKIFTPLKIEDRRSALEMKDLLTVTERIRGSEEIPSSILMHGLAGCGKTSLCHYLVHDFYGNHPTSIDVEGLKNFDLVIFVEVRRTRSSHLVDFLIEECLKNTCKKLQRSDVIQTLQDLRVLFIVDGFDEAKRDVSLKLVKDIFCKFHDQRIVLTTRPEFLGDAKLIARKVYTSFLVVQICGFDEAGLREFSDKVFTAIEGDEVVRKRELESFLNYLEGPGKVLDTHLRLPLTIALLIFLWREDASIVLKVSSATQLYFEIFKLCQKRLRERVEKGYKGQLDVSLDELLLCLGKEAWNLLLDGELLCLGKKEVNTLNNECRRKLIKLTDFLSTYLCCDTDENEDSPARIYAFLHKTQMEYLAGAFLAFAVDNVDDSVAKFREINNDVKRKNEWRRLQEVIKFMTGSFANKNSLDEEKVPEIFYLLRKAEISPSDYNFWWNFYIESLKNRNVGMTMIRDALPQQDWNMDDGNVVAGLDIYNSLHVGLNSMKIDIPLDVNPYDIKNFLRTMRRINHQKNEFKRRGGNIRPVHIELAFWYHEHYLDSQSSNSFLETLRPWAHLTNFTGKLNEKEALSFCYNLRTIRVRLDTPEALRTFKSSLSRIHKKVQTLRVTLGVPFGCSPSDLCSLEFCGKYELTIKGTKDIHASWIVETVKQINGKNGCNKLLLFNTEISSSAIKQILEGLAGVVHEKLTLDTISDITDKQMEELQQLAKSVHIELNCIDP